MIEYEFKRVLFEQHRQAKNNINLNEANYNEKKKFVESSTIYTSHTLTHGKVVDNNLSHQRLTDG